MTRTDSNNQLGGLGSRYSTSLVENRQNEEAAALQDVLNEMANNVYDLNLLSALAHAQPPGGGHHVAGGHHHVLGASNAVSSHLQTEPSYVQERAQEYGRKLQRVGHAIVMKATSAFALSGGDGLADLGIQKLHITSVNCPSWSSSAPLPDWIPAGGMLLSNF